MNSDHETLLDDREEPLPLKRRSLGPAAVQSISGRYEVFERLGEGAVGIVRRARHRLTGRDVALKLIPKRGDDVWVTRFLREVRLASEVKHPGVVEVLDAGEDEHEELLYVAMELLEGETLARRIARPGFERAEGLRLLLQVADALGAAHRAGVVHRDLKPENVFVQEDGTTKLLDFGIAFRPGEARATATGIAVGTPVYMSPEQASKPKEVDARSDVWSFGVMLFEVLSAGSLPLTGDTPAVVLAALVNQEPKRIRGFVDGLDRRLERLVDRCLSKPKGDRPANGQAVHKALLPILSSTAKLGTVRTTELPVATPVQSSVPAVAAAVVGGMLLIASALAVQYAPVFEGEPADDARAEPEAVAAPPAAEPPDAVEPPAEAPPEPTAVAENEAAPEPAPARRGRRRRARPPTPEAAEASPMPEPDAAESEPEPAAVPVEPVAAAPGPEERAEEPAAAAPPASAVITPVPEEPTVPEPDEDEPPPPPLLF